MIKPNDQKVSWVLKNLLYEMYIYILYFHIQKPISKVWGGPLKKNLRNEWMILFVLFNMGQSDKKTTTTTWNVVCMHGWRTYCILIVLFWKNCSYRSVDANIYSFCQCLQVCSCFSHFFPYDWTPHTTVSPQMTLEEKKKSIKMQLLRWIRENLE